MAIGKTGEKVVLIEMCFVVSGACLKMLSILFSERILKFGEIHFDINGHLRKQNKAAAAAKSKAKTNAKANFVHLRKYVICV